MSGINNERSPNISPIQIGTMATSASITMPGIYFRKHSRIKEVRYVDKSGVSKSSSNYISITLQDNASSPVAYAAVVTSDSAAVALAGLLVPLSSPVGDTANQPEVDVPAGTQLNVLIQGTGTGVPTSAVLLVEWYPL